MVKTQSGTKRTAAPTTDNKTAAKEPVTENDPGPRHCTAEERQRLIATSAYYLAEQRGFQGDAALDDWLRAEAGVDAGLSTDA